MGRIQKRLEILEQKNRYKRCRTCKDWSESIAVIYEGETVPDDPWPCPNCGYRPMHPTLIFISYTEAENKEGALGEPLHK